MSNEKDALDEAKQAEVQGMSEQLMQDNKIKGVLICLVSEEGATVSLQSRGITAIKNMRDVLVEKLDSVITKEEGEVSDQSKRKMAKMLGIEPDELETATDNAAKMVSNSFTSGKIDNKLMLSCVIAMHEFPFLLTPFILVANVAPNQEAFNDMMIKILPFLKEAAEQMRKMDVSKEELEESFAQFMYSSGTMDLIKAYADPDESVKPKVSHEEKDKSKLSMLMFKTDGPTTIQ